MLTLFMWLSITTLFRTGNVAEERKTLQIWGPKERNSQLYSPAHLTHILTSYNTENGVLRDSVHRPHFQNVTLF